MFTSTDADGGGAIEADELKQCLIMMKVYLTDQVSSATQNPQIALCDPGYTHVLECRPESIKGMWVYVQIARSCMEIA